MMLGMYWAIHQFPEFEHVDPAQRRCLLWRAAWRAYPTILGLAVLAGLLAFFSAVVATIATVNLIGPYLFELREIGWTAPPAVAALSVYLSQVNQLRRHIRRTIAEGFRGKRLPFCFDCGYNLRGVATPNCPERGRAMTRPAAKGHRLENEETRRPF